MLYYLFRFLEQWGISGSHMWGYISFRALLALILSLVISAWFGEKFIKYLKSKQITETQRDASIDPFGVKKIGVPSMGGVIIILAILVPVLLLGRLRNIYLILMIITTVWLGFLGGMDDFIKIFKRDKEGLKGKYKIIGQISIGLIVGLVIWSSPDIKMNENLAIERQGQETVVKHRTEARKSLKTTIPFVKGHNLDYSSITSFCGKYKVAAGWILFVIMTIFVVTAVSNGANLNDGMDGMCAGNSAIIGVALGILAYVSSHIEFAAYLNIMYIPGSEELVVFFCAFIGALIGFLWYNAYPAQVFMGDTGSLALGGGLAAAAILILMENPAYLLDGGFLLSFGSVIGIGCVWPMVQEGMDVLNRKKRSEVNEKGKIRNKLLMSFLASGVVQLTTLPIVLWFYGEVSVMGIFLNLLVLPTVGIVLGSGTAGALLGLVTVRGAFLAVVPGRIILRGYEFLTVLLGRLSFCTWIGGKPEVWQIVGYYLVLAAAVWIYRAGVKKSENGEIFAWKIRAVYAGMVCFAILLISYRPHEDFRIACLDVGQGDGIVVEIENRWNILIDGGSTNKNELGKYQLLPYLKSRGISRLDGIYVSHTDEDHISGVRELLEFVEKDLTSLRIENLILPKWSDIQENKNYQELTKLAEAAGVRVLTVKAGDEIRYGTVRLKVLWPESTASGKEVNEDAMVLEMISKDFKGLFTGDIGMETEKELIQNGCLEDVDFLKTAHHGSRYSTGAEFLEIVRPELAVVSCSATNTYGHPSPDTLERLKKSGSRVLITRDCGAVTIVNGKSVSAFNRIK